MTTPADYEQWFANHSGMTVDQLHANGLRAVPCACGHIACRGWKLEYSEVPHDES